jgi:hypothetical protein
VVSLRAQNVIDTIETTNLPNVLEDEEKKAK